MTGSLLSDSGKRLAPPLRRLAQFEGGILVAVLAAMVALPVLSVAAWGTTIVVVGPRPDNG